MKLTGRIKDIGRTLSGALTITLESQGWWHVSHLYDAPRVS